MNSHIQGNGFSNTIRRDGMDFTKIEVTGIIEVTIKPGDKTNLVLTAEENILPEVETFFSEGKLYCRTAGSISTTKPILIEVTTKNPLVSVETSGTSKVTVGTLEGPKVYLFSQGVSKIKSASIRTNDLSIRLQGTSQISLSDAIASKSRIACDGSSRLDIRGMSDKLAVTCGGVSEIDASEFPVKNADIQLDGTAKGFFLVTESIAGKVGGVSKLRVKGNPAHRAVSKDFVAEVSYR